MIYYYFICERKLWYFINEISMEQNNELVSIGKILDETTYTREKKNIMIDNTINVDFIKNGAILHEVKKFFIAIFLSVDVESCKNILGMTE